MEKPWDTASVQRPRSPHTALLHGHPALHWMPPQNSRGTKQSDSYSDLTAKVLWIEGSGERGRPDVRGSDSIKEAGGWVPRSRAGLWGHDTGSHSFMGPPGAGADSVACDTLNYRGACMLSLGGRGHGWQLQECCSEHKGSLIYPKHLHIFYCIHACLFKSLDAVGIFPWNILIVKLTLQEGDKFTLQLWVCSIRWPNTPACRT